MSNFTNEPKTPSTFKTFLRHGKEPEVGLVDGQMDVGNRTFQDPTFIDSSKTMADLTFQDLTDQQYINQSKN